MCKRFPPQLTKCGVMQQRTDLPRAEFLTAAGKVTVLHLRLPKPLRCRFVIMLDQMRLSLLDQTTICCRINYFNKAAPCR